MVKFTKSRPSEGASGPSSAIGITRFFDADSTSPKLSPYLVIGIIAVFIIGILVMKFYFFK